MLWCSCFNSVKTRKSGVWYSGTFSPNLRLVLETVQLIFITWSTSVACVILDLCWTPGAGLMMVTFCHGGLPQWKAIENKTTSLQSSDPLFINTQLFLLLLDTFVTLPPICPPLSQDEGERQRLDTCKESNYGLIDYWPEFNIQHFIFFLFLFFCPIVD